MLASCSRLSAHEAGVTCAEVIDDHARLVPACITLALDDLYRDTALGEDPAKETP